MKWTVKITVLPEMQQPFEVEAPTRRKAIIDVLSREMVADSLDRKTGDLVISVFKAKGAGQ
jgi:hypothetical protein